MKSVLLSLVILVVLLAAYSIGIFDLFANDSAVIWAVVLVGLIFVFGIKVLGNPWGATEAKDDENDEK